MPAFVDLSGQRFGRLTVLRRAPSARTAGGHSVVVWECRCDCGNSHFIRAVNLRGGVNSCGCMRNELLAARSRIHGATAGGQSSPEFCVWSNMKDRCFRQANKSWHAYGARGITVCDRWRDNFQAFLSDMGARPSPGHSLERLDVNGDYEPGNCVWATAQEQQRNRRNNVRHAAFGLDLCVPEWHERTGIPESTIRARLRYGWTAAASVSEPVAPKRHRRIMVTREGRTMSLRAWATEMGLPYKTVAQRVTKLGWPVERALTEPVQRRP